MQQKPMPKQDKESGHFMCDKILLSMSLAMSLQTAQRGGKMPPRCFLFFCPWLAFQQVGNPLFQEKVS